MTRKMKDSGVEWIGEIPEDWEKKKLKNVAQFKNGLAHEKNIDMDGKYIVVNSKFVSTEGRVNIYSNELIMKLNLNDVCIVMSDVPNGKAFAKCYIIEQDNKYTLNQRIGCFYDININLRYFYYYLNRNNGLLLFDDGINQTNLRKPDLLNLIFLIPSPKEQERIAVYLDGKCNKIDKTIEKEKEVIEKLKEYKQSVITESVTKGLNPDVKMKDSGVEWISEIPEHWEVIKLKQVFSFRKGLSITKDNLVEQGVKVISYGQIHSKNNNGVSIDDSLIRYVGKEYLESGKQSLVSQNDFIFADTSEDLNGVGNCVFVDLDEEIFAGYHTIILTPINRENISDWKYFAYLYKTDCWRSQIRSRVSGIKLFSITQKILKQAEVIMPDIKEQQEIISYLDKKCSAIDKLITNKEQVIEKLTEYKKSLIYECVTGKKEVIGE